MTVKYNHIEAAEKLSTDRGFTGLKKGLTVAVATFFLALPSAVPAYAAGESESKASPLQSGARPNGLDIVAPVQMAGSDNQSASFLKSLPAINEFLTSNLPEYMNNSSTVEKLSLDPSKLVVQTTSDVRVYFVGEGAGYHNTLGFNTKGASIASGNPKLIFPDASSNISFYNGSGKQVRTSDAPLLPGDFVDLGKVNAGTKLNFFGISNGANGGNGFGDLFSSAGASSNQDGIAHALIYVMPNSPYLLISFEDMNKHRGSDLDYNDLVIAVSGVGLTSAPEPPTFLVFGSFLLLALFLGRRFGMRNEMMAVA